jgi:hypothetical protein
MRIKMLFAYEIIEKGQKNTYRVGETHEFDEETAKSLIRDGRAEPAKKEDK